MRLDLATEPDTQVTIQSISLEKVDRQKLLSNQFAREIEMGIPLSIPVDLPPDHNPGDTQRFFQSALLSYQANGEGLGQFQIRKRLTLDQPVTDALWQNICDDNLREGERTPPRPLLEPQLAGAGCGANPPRTPGAGGKPPGRLL